MVVVDTAAVEMVVVLDSIVVVAAFVVAAIVVAVDNRSEVAGSWAAVAVAAETVNMGLVVVASFIPLLQRYTIHFQLSVSM